MICSVELPVKYLDYSKYFDYDFVIASTCLTHPEYLEYYEKNTRFTILDNGAFEAGEAISDIEYLMLAEKIKPDILVVPDVYKNHVLTAKRAKEFLDAWKRSPIPGVELMGVLQGDSWYSLSAMYWMLYSGNCKYAGLPYAAGVDRYQFLKAHYGIPNVHILGAPTLTEICALNLLPNVVSIDSSLPVKCTMEGTDIEAALVANSYAQPDEQGLDKSRLLANLDTFTAVCHGEIVIGKLSLGLRRNIQ